ARYRRAPLSRQHCLVVALGFDQVDEVGGNEVTLAILALACFHDVTHQSLDFGDVVFLHSANAHWSGCHVYSSCIVDAGWCSACMAINRRSRPALPWFLCVRYRTWRSPWPADRRLPFRPSSCA